jgi:hypothetical protein
MNSAIDLEKEKEENERQLRQLNKSLQYCGGEEPLDYIDHFAIYERYDDSRDSDPDPEWDAEFWSGLFGNLFRSTRKGRRSGSSWGWLFAGLIDFFASFLIPLLWGKRFLRELERRCRPLRLARIMYRLRRRRKAFLRIARLIDIQLREITRVIDVRSVVKVFLQRTLPLNDDEDSNIVNRASVWNLHVVPLIIDYGK